jgi:hypothetical protein
VVGVDVSAIEDGWLAAVDGDRGAVSLVPTTAPASRRIGA